MFKVLVVACAALLCAACSSSSKPTVALPAVGLVKMNPVETDRSAHGTLSFDARATLGNFVGSTDSVRGAMTGGSDLRAVRGWVEANVATLTTGDRKRDRDLRKSMEVERYPTMRFELAGVTSKSASGDSVPVQLHGALTIHGVTRDVVLPATVVRRADQLDVRSDFRLNVKDYHVGGLTKMLGLLKMQEEIGVHIAVVFGR